MSNPNVLVQNAQISASIVGSRRAPIVAATVGNMFECFDLYIYGIMAGTIARLYFPATNDSVSMLLFLGTFGVTFFARPLGAIVLGNLGDKIGRKRVMSLSLLMMTLGMMIVAFAPNLRNDRYRGSFGDRCCSFAARIFSRR